MSDHDETLPDTGFDTPVPELDDHRQPSSSTHVHERHERPRRGTFDSLYGSRQIEQEPGTPAIRVRDFEEAIIDEDGIDLMQSARQARRSTAVESPGDIRSISPPNSVKAFAQARRREREMSFSDPRGELEDGLNRAMSISSRRSALSRSRGDNDAASIQSNSTAEEDVCYPGEENHHKQNELRINFDYLDQFIEAENAAQSAARKDSVTASFTDVRTNTQDTHTMATTSGDFVDLPSEDSTAQEKAAADNASIKKVQAQPLDSNRVSFFSSAWESTINAPTLGDLVLPGEDIRGLFELPGDPSDGVWWLNINRGSKDEVLAICKAFGVHPLTIEDIITQEAREKIELFPSYYFACFRSFNMVEEPDGIEYEAFNIYVLVFRQGTLSFSFAPNTHASQVRKRITALKDYVSLSSDWICYALM